MKWNQAEPFGGSKGQGSGSGWREIAIRGIKIYKINICTLKDFN
jgi:hypothetical protein